MNTKNFELKLAILLLIFYLYAFVHGALCYIVGGLRGMIFGYSMTGLFLCFFLFFIALFFPKIIFNTRR